MKIVKIVATRCHILRLKCTEFNVGWGSAPDPLGELTASTQLSSDPLAGFQGSPSKRREGKGRNGREGGE